MRHIKIFESFDNLRNTIQDCISDLDLVKDDIPFMYEIKDKFSPLDYRYTRIHIPKDSVCVRFFTDRPDLFFEKARYFSVDDYNKFIFPVVSRILDEENIYIYTYLISINSGVPLNDYPEGKIELYKSMLIDSSGGEWISDQKYLLHEVNIIFREHNI